MLVGVIFFFRSTIVNLFELNGVAIIVYVNVYHSSVLDFLCILHDRIFVSSLPRATGRRLL